MASEPRIPRLGRRAIEPERPEDFTEPDFTSWSSKLDAFVPPPAPGQAAAAPAATAPASAVQPAAAALSSAAEPVAAQPVAVVQSSPAQQAAPRASAQGLTESLEELINFDGAMCVALVDSESGMILGRAGSGVELDLAAAGASVMLRARRTTIKTLGLADEIEDLLVTLSTQLQIIRPLAKSPTVFIYLVVDKAKSSLAMARFKATEADGKIVL